MLTPGRRSSRATLFATSVIALFCRLGGLDPMSWSTRLRPRLYDQTLTTMSTAGVTMNSDALF